MKPMPLEPTFLKVLSTAPAIGVDREKKLIRGYVVAQLGVFKDERGEFDEQSLSQIVDHGNAAPNGIKSRFTHPGLSDDGLGKFLGRAKSFRRDEAMAIKDGKPLKVPAVRADLHLSDSSFNTPSGNLGGYVLDLAESDPNALSSSIVLRTQRETRLETDGTPKKGPDGKRLPDLWRIKALHASDIVDEGAAVDGLLSVQHELAIAELPDGEVRLGVELLDRVFEGQSRDVVQARVQAYLRKYLDLRFGTDELDAKRRALRIRIAHLCGLSDPRNVPGKLVEYFAAGDSGNAKLEKVG